jgi:hypothetical protein
MIEAFRMHGREKHTSFWQEKLMDKRQLGRPNHRWEDSIRMDLEEVEWDGVQWIHLAQYRDQ